MKKIYVEIGPTSHDEANSALLRDDPNELLQTVLAVALNEPDLVWAQNYCFGLANHCDANVRGNAMQALGHLARIHGSLDLGRAAPIINAALKDPDESVQGKAECAADDIEHFLGKTIRD